MNLIHHSNIDKIVDEHFEHVCTKLGTPDRNSGRMYWKNSVYCRLEEKYNDHIGSNSEKFFELLFTHYKEILTWDFENLKDILKKIEKEIKDSKLIFKKKNGKKNEDTALMKDVKFCFDYEAYSKSDKPYKTLKTLGVNACPYCNRQYVHTYLSDDGKSRATLDHFFPKNQYPYLALSFYNLVPSCYLCNSNIKGQKDFKFDTHLNPFMGSFESVVAFTINYNKAKDSEEYVSEFYADETYMNIDFKQLVHGSNKNYKRAKNNIKDLCLIDLYNFHKDMVLRLVKKDVIFAKSGLAKSFAVSYPKIFSSEDDVLKTLVDLEKDHKKFNQLPFSRLHRDLTKEFKLELKGI